MWAIAGLICNAFALFALVTPFMLLSLLMVSLGQSGLLDRSEAHEGPAIMFFPLVWPVLFGMVFGLMAMGFGLVAMEKIKAVPRRVGGWGLAVFDVMFLPFWCVLALAAPLMGVVVWSLVQFIKAFAYGTGVFVEGWGALVWAELVWSGPIALALGMGVTAWWTRRVVRRLGRWLG